MIDFLKETLLKTGLGTGLQQWHGFAFVY